MKKVLVVEDNTANRVLLRDILGQEGYQVVEANNGKEGLSMAKTLVPDLILLDIQRPVVDGFAVIRELRDIPETRTIKIIAFTSYAMPDEQKRIAEAGFDAYLQEEALLASEHPSSFLKNRKLR
jgi:two-component system, cell cycle response regulator DivK